MSLRQNANFSRYVLALQYHGGPFCGFAYQKDENQIINGQCLPKSVEGTLSHAFSSLVGEGNYENIQVSSRTDRGVHALWNTMHVDLRPRKKGVMEKWDSTRVQAGLNYYLSRGEEPNHVGILAAGLAPDSIPNRQYRKFDQPRRIDWHARHTATQRTYCYQIINSPVYGNPFDHDRVWRIRSPEKLDVRRMNEAAKFLIGKHDFTSFRGKKCQRSHPVVRLRDVHVFESSFYLPGLVPQQPTQMLTINVTGKSFLYRQVRNIVGTLVSVGKGKLEPEDVRKILEARNRNVAPTMAPARGLFLVDVQHEHFKF